MNAVVQLPVAAREPQTTRATLSECVGHAACRYLHDLGTTETTELYELFLQEMEQPLLREVMAWAGGNQSRAAQTLGLSRATLRKKLQRYGLL